MVSTLSYPLLPETNEKRHQFDICGLYLGFYTTNASTVCLIIAFIFGVFP